MMLAVNNPGINPAYPGLLRHPGVERVLGRGSGAFLPVPVLHRVAERCRLQRVPSRELANESVTFFDAAWSPWFDAAWILFVRVGLSALKQHQLVLAGVLQHIAITLPWPVRPVAAPTCSNTAYRRGVSRRRGSVRPGSFANGQYCSTSACRPALYSFATAEGLPVAVAREVQRPSAPGSAAGSGTGDHRRISPKPPDDLDRRPAGRGVMLAAGSRSTSSSGPPATLFLWHRRVRRASPWRASGWSTGGIRRPVEWLKEPQPTCWRSGCRLQRPVRPVPDRLRLAGPGHG